MDTIAASQHNLYQGRNRWWTGITGGIMDMFVELTERFLQIHCYCRVLLHKSRLYGNNGKDGWKSQQINL